MTWGSRTTLEVSSANPDDTPVWVDLSAYLMHAEGLELSIGRQDNLDQTQPSSVQFTLRNTDDRFTYGNTSSPYASWWGPGRKCRLRETYGSTVVDLFTGYLQVPVESTSTASANSQRVSVTAVDRLARLAAAPAFMSTLAAHIVYSGGSELVGYWTLCDPAAPFRDLTHTQCDLDLFLNYPSNWATATTKPSFEYQGGTGAPGDELSPIIFTPSDVYAYAYELINTSGQSLSGSFSNGQFLTFVFWLNLTAPPGGAVGDELLFMGFRNGADINTLQFERSSSGIFTVSLFGGTMSATITTSGSPWGTPIPVGIQVGIGPNSLKLWVGNDEYTATPSGSPASPQTFSGGNFFVGWLGGSIWHLQIYTGSVYSRTMFLAQREVGNNGMQRQTPGARIRTLAGYAGIPTAEYTSTVDPGTTVMQTASLADKTPLEAMREAERTEQGLLYVDGFGRLVFRDRRSLYNI